MRESQVKGTEFVFRAEPSVDDLQLLIAALFALVSAGFHSSRSSCLTSVTADVQTSPWTGSMCLQSDSGVTLVFCENT